MGRLNINYERSFSAYSSLKEEDIYEGMTFGYFKDVVQNTTHLYIILTEPETYDDHVVVVTVNVTSIESKNSSRRKKIDRTVLLNSEDHPAISHPSFVFYKEAEFWSVDKLLSYLKDEQRWCKDDVDGELLEKIQEGLIQSDQTPEEIREFCRIYFEASE